MERDVKASMDTAANHHPVPGRWSEGGAKGTSFQSQVRPNILLVLTDDQDAGSISEMPNVQSQLVDKGTTYDRAFATTPCAALREPPYYAASTPTTMESGTTSPRMAASRASRS